MERASPAAIRYRLDPGERGVAFWATPSQSIARVASHELGNLLQFRAKAMREGGYVVYSRLKLDLVGLEGKLAARAGRSEALIVYPRGRKVVLPDNPFLYREIGPSPRGPEGREDERADPEGKAPKLFEEEIEELEESPLERSDLLEEELTSLEARRERLQRERERAEERLRRERAMSMLEERAPAGDEEERRIEAELRRIEAAIASKRAEELSRKLGALLYQAISKTSGLAMTMARLSRGALEPSWEAMA